jgi:hypothetical protein
MTKNIGFTKKEAEALIDELGIAVFKNMAVEAYAQKEDYILNHEYIVVLRKRRGERGRNE